MICTTVTVKRLLGRLPAPRRATPQDIGRAAAFEARSRALTGPVEPKLAALLDELHVWQDAAHRRYDTPQLGETRNVPGTEA